MVQITLKATPPPQPQVQYLAYGTVIKVGGYVLVICKPNFISDCYTQPENEVIPCFNVTNNCWDGLKRSVAAYENLGTLEIS